MLLFTLAFNERIIIGTIDILLLLVKILNLIEKIVYDKVIMIRGNLFTIKNVIQTLFYCYINLIKMNKFDWLMPTARHFHFQINLFIMLDLLILHIIN